MGLADVVAHERSDSDTPPGCYWSSNGLYYNTVSSSPASCTSYSEFCLCVTAPDCAQTNGATSNAASCLCGATGVVCSAASGLFCNSSLNVCGTAPIAACATTDGSSANSVTCVCGNVACTESTGLICSSVYGGGSCRKTDFGEFAYLQETSNKRCVDVSNRKPILDKAACEAAATSMGLGDVVADDSLSWRGSPPGCSYRYRANTASSSLYFNTMSSSPASCTSYSNFCLCVAAPNCTQTNGATSNTAPCLCGETGFCTAASGLFCTAPTSTCSSGDLCASVDGSSRNTGADCSCGTAACNSLNGMFCYAEGSKCSATIFSNLCPIRDGSAANDVACTCGTEECTSTTGLICYSQHGGGACRKTGFGEFGYAKEEDDKKCGDMSHRKPILDKTSCETAATSMGLGDVEAYELSSSYYPPGCYWRPHWGYMYGNSLYYNTKSTSTTSCTYQSNFCLCIAAPDCTHTNGMTSNTAPCLCGETGCTPASGLFCNSSTSTCSRGGPCTNTNGFALNTIACACGSVACNSFNGMYCDSSVSQCAPSPITACAKTDGSSASSVTCKCGNVACTESTGLICYST